jgi:hypothetical protein
MHSLTYLSLFSIFVDDEFADLDIPDINGSKKADRDLYPSAEETAGTLSLVLFFFVFFFPFSLKMYIFNLFFIIFLLNVLSID